MIEQIVRKSLEIEISRYIIPIHWIITILIYEPRISLFKQIYNSLNLCWHHGKFHCVLYYVSHYLSPYVSHYVPIMYSTIEEIPLCNLASIL